VTVDEQLVAQFYNTVYLDAFAAQREPLDAWLSALRGEQPYRMYIRIEREGDAIAGGITYELYPTSMCGLITYVVVAEHARGAGLGKRLVFDATNELLGRGAHVVFGEMNDPRVRGDWERLERFQRWGCRVVDVRYVQPALGPGLARDRDLVLIVHPPLAEALDGAVVRDFVRELYEVTERRAPDTEVEAILEAIPDRVALVELAR
jgi:hypothetical protein